MQVISVSDLRQSRSMRIVNRSKRLKYGCHLKVALSVKHVELVQPFIFLFLLLDVLPDGGFLSANS